jgi:hypothetical protein
MREQNESSKMTKKTEKNVTVLHDMMMDQKWVTENDQSFFSIF